MCKQIVWKVSVLTDLYEIAHDLRCDIARMFYRSCSGHFAPALSCVDIFTVLYFGGIVNVDKRETPERDRVILSKGHACAALYASLARAGYFHRAELATFYQDGSRLAGHPSVELPGIETATGALGHGTCFATGTALAAKIDAAPYRTYVVMGDGELQEGSVYEAASFAGREHLEALTVILDANGLQASDRIENIAPLGDIAAMWRLYGWNVVEVDGHDPGALKQELERAKAGTGKPNFIIAHTVKGKGVSIAEASPDWHSRAPRGDEWDIVCHDLRMTREELETL